MAAPYGAPSQITMRSTSSSDTSSSRRSYSPVVRADSCPAICWATSTRPPFFRYVVHDAAVTGMVLMGVDTAFTGGAAPSYPDLIGPVVNENIRQSNGVYLTEQNFVAAPFGDYGTLARNALHGPGVSNVDASVLRMVTLKERLRAQFRASRKPHDFLWILPILLSSLPSRVGSLSFPNCVLLLPFNRRR